MQTYGENQADKTDEKTPKEQLKVISKKKKFLPRQLIETALNKDKAEKLKKEIRFECGVRTLYWNHTKNYSTLNKQEEDNYVAEKVKKYNLSKFLTFFMEKNYQYSLLRKFIREYIKDEPFSPEDRQKVTPFDSGMEAPFRSQ
jgi:biotin synthase-like enzyme